MFAELLSVVILLFQTLNPFFKRGIFFIFLFEKTLVEFGDFINQVDKSKDSVQKALDEAQLLFDSLMQQYFG